MTIAIKDITKYNRIEDECSLEIKKKTFDSQSLVVRVTLLKKMTDLITTAVKTNLGIHLLQWAISHSDFWKIANRCTQLVQDINDPLDKSADVLNNILTMDEDDIDAHCITLRDLNLQQIHYQDDENGNNQIDRIANNNNNQGSAFRNRPQGSQGMSAFQK